VFSREVVGIATVERDPPRKGHRINYLFTRDILKSTKYYK